MNKAEIITIAKSAVWAPRYCVADPLWIKAFAEYNAENPMLGMGCTRCYGIVLAFHISRLKE